LMVRVAPLLVPE
jgi:hypothetical protein